MKTDLSKSLKCGFVLDEDELRRLVSTIVERFRRVDPDPTVSYEVRTRGGSVLSPADLDELFFQDNAGPASIASLMISVTSQSSEYMVSVTFVDANQNPESWGAVRIKIAAPERDWAFIASSEIDERIKRCRSFAPGPFIASRWVLPVLSMVPFVSMLLGSWFMESRSPVASELERRWRSGEIRDPVQALVALERMKAARSWAIPAMMAAGMLGMLMIFAVFGLIDIVFRPYVFNWGDTGRAYQRSRATLRTVVIVGVIGLVISVVGGVIANRLQVWPVR